MSAATDREPKCLAADDMGDMAADAGLAEQPARASVVTGEPA